MKKFILLFAFLIGNLSVFAQAFQEVVYLKNGSIIRGVIIEQVPNESLKIQTADGSIFAYKMNEVEKITKEARKKAARASSFGFDENVYRPKGYRGFFDIDGGFGVKEWGDGYIGFTTSHGFQTCPYFFIGAGMGIEYHVGWETLFMPIFGNMHFNFLDKRFSPFLDIKGGYSPVDGKGGYISTAIGVNYQFTPRIGVNFSFGYTMQRTDVYYLYSYYKGKVKMHHLGFKLGLEF